MNWLALAMFWIKKLLFVAMVLVQILLLYQALQWILVPGYSFPPAKVFSGKSWYNPYPDSLGGAWVKSNFQIQSRTWGGLTNGRNNHPEAIRTWYEGKGYGFLGISDYMSIRAIQSGKSLVQVPCYEHGYNVYKVHHVLLGPKQGVDWVDWPLWQDIHVRQWKTQRLQGQCEVLCLAHPSKGGGFEPSDFTLLTGFRLMELRSTMTNSLVHWDSCLSAGRPAFLLFNDDAHDLQNPKEPGFVATLVPFSREVPTLYAHLEAGHAVGYKPHEATDHGGWDGLKAEGFQWCIRLNGDTAYFKPPTGWHEIIAYGQGGSVLQLERFDPSIDEVSFVLPQQGYLRLEVGMKNEDRYWLNPLIKTDEKGIPKLSWVSTSLSLTWKRRIGGFLIFVLSIGMWWTWKHLRKQ